jgi:hypothetical protein
MEFDMPIPPEVAFDRAIRSMFPEYLRASYTGKLNIDPVRDALLYDIQERINEMYGEHASRFVADHNRVPQLYFDFISGDAVNALAFSDAEYSFVGLTGALMDELGQLSHALVSSEETRELFGRSELGSDQGEKLWLALIITTVQFVGFHELGHHVYGHCPSGTNTSVGLMEEFRTADSRARQAGLEAQADELDADGYAIRTLADNLLTGSARPEILGMLGRASDEERDDSLLTAITLSVGSFFLYRQHPGKDLKDMYTLDHPPAPARLYMAMNAVHDWMVMYRAKSEEWLVGGEYLRIMEIAARSLKRTVAAAEAWNLETSVLESADGKVYLNSLEEARQERRETLKSRRWRLGAP